uniref:Replication timing regulatory factor 1 n=1 Tax=Oncorhynchus mykiss TaxID=8022 RepID=A0A8K9UXY3_ONCMY
MVPPTSSGFLPLLESLEDSTAGQPEQTEAYLTITHISSQNAELSQAALQALGFCVFHVHVVSAISANFAEEILSALSSLVVKSTDKNTCTRALWVISKQNFPTEVVAKKVPEILGALECVRTREDIQSVVMEHESLNVVISLLEQASAQMGEDAVQWAKLVIPLVVHSASKVRLRAAAALEMGLPLLLEKQKEVAAIVEPLMSSKLIPELQKLFSTKNETNVLKLWPLFVRLLGKLLHRGGPFINSLLGLEELGFRSSSPNIKKTAFIAWKSLIDNFALNPEILCSAKRLKLLLQPLSSIQVRTEALLLTKLEVWWYLVVKLGANLPAHFEQVGVPLLQCTLGPDSALPIHTSLMNHSSPAPPGSPAFSGTMVPRLNLNTSVVVAQAYPSIQLLGLEMLLHYFLGSEVTTAAAKNKLTLSLEPISHPFLSSPFSFTKHAPLLITAVHDSFICIGKDAPDALLSLIWKNLVSFVSTTIDAGNKKERQGSEVLTLLLQALQSIISSEALPANRALSLLELTVKGIPQRVLGSASYQVGKMDVLNGTPALFLILLFYNHSLVAGFVEDERFFLCLETLVSCGLSGPTSPLAFGEAVLAAVGHCAGTLENKEQLWRMWSLVVNPLTDTITQTNEVNQGDALEHNFSAVLTALMFPIIHLLPGKVLPQMTQKALLGTWCRLYKVFARCSALVATAEENVCCEELFGSLLMNTVDHADFSPYTPQFQQKMKSPHTHLTWVRKKSKALGNLDTFQTLLVQSLETFNALEAPETAPNGTGLALVSILSILFSNLSLGTAIQEALASLSHPLVALYEQAGRTPNEQRKCTSSLGAKLEKLLSDVLGCLQIRSALAYDDELLSLLSPLLCVLFLHRRKQVRSLATQFWNATFANTLVLVYPEELKPVLSQVKQNTPIILPGFQSVEVPDELSGQSSVSSESSQLETKLSGVQVTSGVKRDSLLPRAEEIKDRTSKTSTKPVSTKLDFGSHKLPRREELEEQASIDFVFIPPETKERVLTEHQKEVKRTKRSTNQQSLEMLTFSHCIMLLYGFYSKGLTSLPSSEVLAKDTQEYISPTNEMAEPAMEEEPPEEVLPESVDVSMEDANEDVPLEDSDVAMESREEGTSPIVSGGSDIISGTPKKHNSRRQSFITLEKYAEGKPASPANVVKFTGPLTRTLNSQEQEPASQKPSEEIEADTDRQDSQETEQVRHKSSRNESFLKEEEEHESSENKKESEVEIIAEKQSSETTEDDVIPDTQTQVEVLKEVPVPAVEEVMGNNSQEEEESKGLLEDYTSSQSTLSQGEPRRSGRRRSRPLRPGEDTEERDDLDKQRKKSQPGEDVSQTDSPKTTPSPASPTDSQSQGRASRRSKLAVEEDGGKDKLRKRSHKEVSELSQSNSQVAKPSPAGDSNSLSQGWRSNKLVRESEELVKDKRKRRGVAKEELSQSDSLTVTASDNDSQSQSRRSQRSKLAVEVEDDGNQKQKGGRAQKEKRSQTDSHVAKPSQLESQSQGRTSRSKAVSDSEEFDLPDKVEKQDPTEEEQSQRDSQMATRSPAAQTGDEHSQGISSGRSKLVTQSEEQGKDKQRRVGTENTLCQIDSKITTPSATPKYSQSQGRASRKSKVPLEVAELEDKTSPNVATDSAAAPEMSQTDSQVTPSATRQTDSQPRPRGRSSKRSKLEEQLKASSSPMPTPTIETHSSQVADQAGTQESPQGSRRTTRRRASQGLLSSNVEESDTSETREDAQKPKKRGRNPKSTEALQSPLATVGSGEPGAYLEIPMDLSESSLKSESDLQNPLSEALEVKIPQDVDETIKSINSLKPVMDVLKLPLITKNNMGQREDNTEIVDIEGECENTKLPSQLINSSFKSDLEQLKSQHFCISPRKNLKTVSSQEGVHSDFGCEGPTQLQNKLLTDSEQANSPVPSADGKSFSGYESVLLEPNKLCTPPISIGLPTDTSPSEAAEEKLSLSLQVAESSGEKLVDVPKPVTVSSEEVTEEQMGEDKENRHPESTNNVLEEDQPEEDVFMSIVHTQPEGFNGLDEEQQEEQYTCIKEGQPESDNTSTRTRENDTEPQANDVQDITPLQERAKMDTVPSLECEEEDGEETQLDNNDLALHPLDSVAPLTFDTCEAPVPLHHPSTSKDVLCQDSPPKQKGLEAMMGLEVGQSPSSGRIRGMWTPSASPSTSILKKGQKRPIEEESSSPFTKSRRVSFADPIQHQELADDIDRRSPIIRSSSPRAKTASSSITQPKYITTPTKGLMILSPRNLRSPGYKSSKKCLISEMSREPRPIPKDCVYPALVSCSTPVEAVLPQITSNMWPRGFGHLVRARNIKTVGDLSALTPSEIKNLPIRSPKISNVKTALKTYHEQQVMSKTFKTQGPEERLDQSRPDHQRPEGDLLLEVESLGARLAGEELSRCSPDQLVQLHDQLGGMMKNVVVQLQSRLLSHNKDSGP